MLREGGVRSTHSLGDADEDEHDAGDDDEAWVEVGDHASRRIRSSRRLIAVWDRRSRSNVERSRPPARRPYSQIAERDEEGDGVLADLLARLVERFA